MKKFIFTLLIAMSFTSAIAKSTGIQEPVLQVEKQVDIYNIKPVSLNLKSATTERQCVRACFQTYRQCLGSAGTGSGYWECELEMEQCTTACAD